MAILSSSTSTTFNSKLLPILSLLLYVLIFNLPAQLVYCDLQAHSTNQNEQNFHHYTHLQDQPPHYNPSDSIDSHQINSDRSLLFDRYHQQQHNHYPLDYLDSSYTDQPAASGQHDVASLRQINPVYNSGQQVEQPLSIQIDTDPSHYNDDDVRWTQYNHQQHQQQQQPHNDYLNLESSQHLNPYPTHSETKQPAFVEPHNEQHQHNSQHDNNDRYHQQTDYYQSSQTHHYNHHDNGQESRHRQRIPNSHQYQQVLPTTDHQELTHFQAGELHYQNSPEQGYAQADPTNSRPHQSDHDIEPNNHKNRHQSSQESKHERPHVHLPDCQRIVAAAAASSHSAIHQDNHYESLHNKQFLLVATLDGLIYAIDLRSDGQIKWTKKVGNLFSSTVGSFGYNSPNKGELKLIPSLDGKLYFHRTASNTLEILPLDADSLLKNSHRLGDDFFLSGGKKHHIHGIDPIAGSSIYDCGINGCEYPKVEKISHENILVLERTNRIVRAIHPKTGTEQWSIDVSQLRMRLVKNLEECQSLHKQAIDDESPEVEANRNYALPQIEWDIQKGYISSKNHHWFHQFKAPITSIWTLEDGYLVQMELFNFSPSKEDAILSEINLPVHIGSHNNQLYVQTSPIHDQYAKLIQYSQQDYYMLSEPENTGHDSAIVHQDQPNPQIEWYHKPGLTENEIVEFYEQGLDHPTLLTELDYGINAKPKESCEKPQLLKTSVDETCPPKTPSDYPSNSSPKAIDRHDIHINDDGTIAYHQSYDNSFLGMFNAVSYYWREFATLCLLTALFLNWLFVIVKRKLIKEPSRPRRQTMTKKSSSERRRRSESVSIPQHTPDQLKEEYTALTDRSASKSNMNDNTPNIRHRTNRAFTLSDPCVNNSIWSTPPNSLSSSLNTSSMFKSRYSSDFDSIRRLGRGGFGVVFEAKNKIDDCHYAVKRICLPLEKDARERVMREVKALAKLDHSGIVRYYNAWLETPPEEWLKEHDKQFGISSNKDQFKTSLPSTYDTETDKVGLNTCDFSAGAKFRKEVGDTSSSDLMIGRRKVNGFKSRLLQSNSNSQSLDVVFEGSGSIRLESDSNGDGSGGKQQHKSSTPSRPIPITNNLTLREEDESEQSSESDDDMLQFSTRPRSSRNKYDPEESSFSYDLSEPFSSSDEENSNEVQIGNGKNVDNDGIVAKTPENDRNRNQLTNLLLADNLHTEKAYLYIQMQLCRKDTLKDWLLTNCDKRDKTVIFDLFYQIVDAVEYVHSQDLIHRDLKPSNIFFSMDGIVKIGDFGLVTAKSTGIGSSLDLHENVAECDADRCIDAVHTEQVGTQLYMSPEQINGVNYNHKVDIFAMGLILLELLVPFRTQMQRINVLVKARNQFFSDDFKKNFPKEHLLLKSLLCRNPQKRPSAAELKQHELLTNCQLSAPVIERLYQRRRTISSNSSTE